jgi:8-oxo-dGTP pyrophosphatase MutT (NUDIX family)
VGAHAASVPALTVADREVVEIADSCIAKLLADSVRGLAAAVGPSSEIEEPAFEKPPSGNRSAGIVLVDDLGRLTIREPANHFAGYEHSYAKGRVDPGETPRQAALRELTEETGLVGRSSGSSATSPARPASRGSTSASGPAGTEAPSAETWAVKTVSPFVALALLNVQRDKEVLYRLVELAAPLTAWTWPIAGQPMRCRLEASRVLCAPEG